LSLPLTTQFEAHAASPYLENQPGERLVAIVTVSGSEDALVVRLDVPAMRSSQEIAAAWDTVPQLLARQIYRARAWERFDELGAGAEAAS
jgi:hypothetical protein